jgi:A/G-specific adenine glycosylase
MVITEIEYTTDSRKMTLFDRKILSKKRITRNDIHLFRKTIRQYYRRNARNLPWRKTKNPYHILVSEIMLQQTQVERVIEKYEPFLSAFPDFSSLAQAPLRTVLSLWQGLGYNRRVLALQRIAQEVMTAFNGTLPSSEDILVKFPGIGKATAAAIAAFAFNKPPVFIETNIRRVFIHFFFHDEENVSDADIFPLIEKTLDTSDPRHWYYALMDYGAMLKKQFQNPNRKSAHYQRQTSFEGSNRQIRGMVLKAIIATPSVTESTLVKKLNKAPEKLREVLIQLQKEGFIQKQGKGFTIV